ncbi:outer membrane protein assembly factor BamA [Pelagibacterales bacterium SAG-MED37]|nr:outer membrane protein assembly factor BamA [Pelagibacterales bacterium SAG-MED37]
MYRFRLIVISLFIFVLSINNLKAETVNKIIVEGNNRVSPETVIMFSGVSINDDLSENNLNQVLKQLYESNFFELVSVKIKNNILRIKVKEYPIIQNVIYEGVKSSEMLEDLKKGVNLKSRSSFNEILLIKDKEDIASKLKSLGYYFAEIDTSVEELSDNKVNLVFNISIGKKAKIKKISFVGNKIYKDKKLKSIILSEEYKAWKFLSGKKFLNEAMIEYDKRLLKNFYLNKGYFNVVINSSFAKMINDQEFELVFNIDANPKLYFGKFKLNLPTDFSQSNYESLNKFFNKLENEPYSLYHVENILDKIEEITVNEQYESIKATIEETIIDNKINISFNIEETERLFIERINIFGNNVTKESVIRNQIEIDEGDPFNSILYTKSLNNIKSLNFFENVEGEVLEGNKFNSKIINITIIEKATGEIFAGVGTGTGGSNVSFGVKENNYLGSGVVVDTNLSLSETKVKGKLFISNPNYKNSDKSLNLNIESSVIDRLSTSGYKSNVTGFSLGTDFEYLDDLRFGISTKNLIEKITVDSKASAKQKKQEGNYFDNFLGMDFSYDKRNQRFQTTSGFFSNYSVNVPVLSDTNTLMNSYNYKIFKELYDENVSTLSFLIKSSTSITGDNVKLSERLYIPARKLRGFEAGKVGPKDGSDYVGGNYISTINATSTIPKILENVQSVDIVMFADVGNIWGVDYNSSLDVDEIRSSVGVGLDWLTPVGPLTFSLAHPITQADSDVTEMFRFNLGTSF